MVWCCVVLRGCYNGMPLSVNSLLPFLQVNRFKFDTSSQRRDEFLKRSTGPWSTSKAIIFKCH